MTSSSGHEKRDEIFGCQMKTMVLEHTVARVHMKTADNL